MKKYSFFLLCFFLKSPVNAQKDTLSLNLNEAISYALENSLLVKKSQNDYQKAVLKKWETIATGLPQINADVNYLNNLKQPFEPVDFNRDGNIDFGATQSLKGTVTLTQLIFDGSYIVGVQSAKTYLEIYKNLKTKTNLSVKETVISTYLNVLMTQESLKILEKNKENLIQILNQTQQMFENGFAEEESVEQLKINLNTLESRFQNTLQMEKINQKMLNITLGNEIERPLKLTENLKELSQKNTQKQLLKKEFDVEKNIDYQISLTENKSKYLLLKLEKMRRLPTISTFANYAYLGNAKSFSFFEKSQFWIPTSAFGVNIKIPIFSSLKGLSRIKQARLDYENSNYDLQQNQKMLQMKVQREKSNYQMALEDCQNAKKSERLAEKIADKNQIKFLEGMISSIQLSQTQNQLYTQQQNYLKAMLNVVIAKNQLEQTLKPIP